MATERNKGGRAHHETEQDTSIANRRKLVAANLLAGVDYRTIAESVGVSLGTIASDVKAVMEEWRTERIRTIDEYKQLQLTRLDTLLNGVWDKARNGDGGAIANALNIMDRQARLMGIDVVRVAGAMGRMSDDEAKRIILAGATGILDGTGEPDEFQDVGVEGVPTQPASSTD